MARAETILETEGLTKHYDGLKALFSLNLIVGNGETIGIIGPNGAGKTTLFNLIAGTERVDEGYIRLDGADITRSSIERRAELGILRTFQNGRVFGNLSVWDNLLATSVVLKRRGLRVRDSELRQEILSILALFEDRLLSRLDDPAYGLSYANRRRLELARSLVAQPRVLLLDEPTAGMNPTETQEILEIIRSLKYRGYTMIIIEHKLPLIIPVSDRVVVLDEGEKIAEGNGLAVAWDPRVIKAYLGDRRFGEGSGSLEKAIRGRAKTEDSGDGGQI